MKFLPLVFLLSFHFQGWAQEVKFTGPAWDSLATPLGITAYFLSIDSPVEAKRVTIEMDLYKKGVFVRTIPLNGASWDKAHKLQLNMALYFPHESIPQGKCVLEWNKSSAVGELDIPKAEFPLGKGGGSGAINSTIKPQGRVPVFLLITGTSGTRQTKFSSAAEDTPKDNPEAHVIIGYLKTE